MSINIAKQLAGKTIIAVHKSEDTLILFFTDKTYVIVESSNDYDGNAELDYVISDSYLFHHRSAFVKAGFMTEAERKEMEDEHRKKRDDDIEARERRQYKMLQEKYK